MKLIKIGRSKENDVVLENDSNISRKHAEIFQDDEGRVFLTDLGSANGTYINGNKVTGSTLLKQLDIVKIGKTVLPWKNFLKEQNLDGTIAKKIIQQQKKAPVKTEKKDESLKKGNQYLINSGYAFSIFMLGIIGLIIGIYLINGKFDSRTKNHGYAVTGISIIKIIILISKFSYQ